MDHSRIVFGLLAVLLGCDFEDKAPRAPDGYPQLDPYQEGEADLVIGGDNYVTESRGGTRFNVEGGFEDELRATTSFDYDFDLTYRDVEVGVYTANGGDLVATYDYDFFVDASCGKGRVEVVGRKRYDAGFSGEGEFIWGTIQLEFCESDYEAGAIPGAFELSGR